jgi:RNA polymerase sigma factor (sigma-70 family)
MGPQPELQDAPDTRRAALVALLSRIAGGDRTALRDLYDRTSAKLFGVCVRICVDEEGAADVLQEVYVSIWHRAAAYDPERASPITWLATIARNRAIDWRRARRHVERSVPLESAADVPDDTITAPQLIDDTRAAMRLHACLDTLEDRASAAIREAYFNGFSYAELAVRRAVPLGTMKSWIRRGLDRLKKCLTDVG